MVNGSGKLFTRLLIRGVPGECLSRDPHFSLESDAPLAPTDKHIVRRDYLNHGFSPCLPYSDRGFQEMCLSVKRQFRPERPRRIILEVKGVKKKSLVQERSHREQAARLRRM